ncbi:RsfS/YbeB/iojap family protein [Aspergillus lucknowensis]|uniref:ATPase synthesis protein 25 n=1 Tax=Aspergillus lucknowensis TaxID=176173 RepID=A0ABR4LM30_9EURO
MSAMMNRVLLRAPKRYHEAARFVPSATNPTILRPTFPMYRQVRPLTLTSSSHLPPDHPISSQSAPPNALSAQEDATPESNPASESSQSVPWYLQEEGSIPAGAEVSSRDKLPELPENPPKILPELLEYVFKDLGLDELKLLDLRGLEIPPALGANVIMVLGTVRSVKHLNVSADRLCRWLRSNHKLTPYADGLLGRNELKIKLRRKNRRARLASRTGAMVDDKDDGITTGWICVNAGVVDKNFVPEQAIGDFEGFGHLGSGTRLVVQLFTEEKRAELDLEGLWEGRIARALQEKQKQSDVPADAPEEVRTQSSRSPSSSDNESRHVLGLRVSLPLEQRRRVHFGRHQGSSSGHNVAAIRQFMSQSHGPAEKSGSISWQTLYEYLENLPDKQFKSALDRMVDAKGHNDFEQLFSESLEDATDSEKLLAKVELTSLAISRQHPEYSKEELHKLFIGCCVWGVGMPGRIALFVVDALLKPRKGDNPKARKWLPDSDRQLALDVLDHLSLSGVNLMNMQIWNKLYDSASLPVSPQGDDLTPAARASHVLRMIESLEVPFDHHQARLLLSLLFRNGDYEGFWRWWRKLPLNHSRRTRADYEMLFRLHADLGNAAQARECLNTWIPMMREEEPPVLLEGELVVHIMKCLTIAEPNIQLMANSGSDTNFARLWRECESRGEW